ncbi:MAG: hypothetical protein M3R24_05150 [Chloroflexota bacterium]|nr:hypothetical protein [Chloroflexota bacterium]
MKRNGWNGKEQCYKCCVDYWFTQVDAEERENPRIFARVATPMQQGMDANE